MSRSYKLLITTIIIMLLVIVFDLTINILLPEKFKLKQFSELDHPAKPGWPLDEDGAFLKGAGVRF